MAEEIKTEVEVIETEIEVIEVKLDTKNPLNKGVSYEDFLENVKGNTTVESLLKKLKLDKDTFEWLITELNNYKQTKTK